MQPDLPTLGIRFDIDRVGSSDYGAASWKIILGAVKPEEIPGALLFEGDTWGTLNGTEDVFCIAVQTTDAAALQGMMKALSTSEEFKRVCARPAFFEGEGVIAQPLVNAEHRLRG